MTVKQCQFLCKFKCNLQNCDTEEDAEDEPYGWWKMVEWPRRSLVRLVQWLLGRLTWTCTFVWRLYAFPELNRCQSNQIKQDVTQLLKQISKQIISQKIEAISWLLLAAILHLVLWLIQNFDFFLRFLLFILLKQLSKKSTFFLFSKQAAIFRKFQQRP